MNQSPDIRNILKICGAIPDIQQVRMLAAQVLVRGDKKARLAVDHLSYELPASPVMHRRCQLHNMVSAPADFSTELPGSCMLFSTVTATVVSNESIDTRHVPTV